MDKIEIKTRFNASDFQEEITEKLKENGFIEYEKENKHQQQHQWGV